MRLSSDHKLATYCPWRAVRGLRLGLAAVLLLCTANVSAARPQFPAATHPLALALQPAQNSPASQSQGGPQVIIKNFSFQPAQLTARPGETVEFKNEDMYAHTVTADDGSFDSGLIQPGSSWKLTVTKPGTIAYHCRPHPNMVAKLVATGAGASPANASTAKSGVPAFNPPSKPQEFHPILVNFTAALLPLAFLSDLLGLWFKRASLHNASAWMMLYEAIITPITGAAGWWWKAQSASALPANIITMHQWLGTSLAVVFILLAIWRWTIQKRNVVPGAVYLIVTAIVALALVYQGSLGGLMAFGK
jgi:plastocyanin/uncharacterized membrane protein